MPLTLSHPAAVLPLQRLGLPMTAMVAGSMVPDIPLFLGWHRGYQTSHSIVGIVTVDVTLTAALVWLWFALVRDALVDLSPDPIRSRLAPHVSLSARQWLLVLPAAIVGALTHVAWDAFTHPGRWGVSHLTWLQAQHGALPGFKWAQYTSGVVGLTIVTLAAISYLRALPVLRQPAPRPAWAHALLPAAATLAAACGVTAAASRLGAGLHAMAFHGVVNALVALAIGLFLVTLAWAGLLREPSNVGQPGDPSR